MMKLSEYRKRVEGVQLARVPRKLVRGKDKDGEPRVILKSWEHIASRVEKGVAELVYRVPVGYSYLDLEKQVDALYAACGAVVELKDYAGAVMIRIFPEDFKEIPYNAKMLELTKGKDILIGFDRQGEPLIHSLRVPHMLIGGQSGYGKTDFIRWILFQLIAHNSPEEVEIWIVDLKGFSFLPFIGIPHIPPGKIATDLPGAKLLLEQAVKTMEDRKREVWNSQDRSKTEGYKTLFVLIDEAYMISPNIVPKEEKDLARACDSAAAKISGTGREAGVGLLYCTQRPDAEVVNPLVKANMDCTVAFRTKTESNSMIILDRPDAARLPHKKPGRVLYSSDDLTELQCPYIGKDDEWEKKLAPYKRSVPRETTRENFNPPPGDTDSLDGANSEVLFPKWEPVKESLGDPQEIGGGETCRGQAAGDRQKQAMEIVVDWTEIFKDR